MPQKSWLGRNEKRIKQSEQGKESQVRVRNRCFKCGRPRAHMRKFGLCRICFREDAHAGKIPGVYKSSW